MTIVMQSAAAGPQDVPVAEGAAIAPKKSRTKTLVASLVAIAALGAAAGYVHGLGKESTDDAQVEGRVVTLSTRVPGQIAHVFVIDNQIVEAGQTLVELDPADYEAKAEAARANVEAAKATLENAKASLALVERTTAASLTQARGGITQAAASLQSTRAAIAQAQAEIDTAEAKRALAELSFGRAKTLLDDGATSQADVDARRSEYDAAAASLAHARALRTGASAATNASGGAVVLAEGRLAAAQTGPEQIAEARAAVTLAEARVRQNEAARKLAELDVTYTQIRAPKRGVIARRTVEEGQMASPERPLLALVPLDDIWVVANFKEDQLEGIHPGERAEVSFDTYGRRDFPAHVESIAGGAGARFALLPPDNASGNFVKVVQRVPVLLRLDAASDVDLRPGMSADVTVHTAEKAP